MPSSRHSCRKGSLVYSPQFSEQSTLIFLPVLYSMFLFHSTNNFRIFPLCFYGIYPTSPRVIIYKRHKVVVTSNRCHFDRYSDICMNIIHNPLGAMSRDTESHLVIFPMMQCSQKSNLPVLALFNRPYFARACKDFFFLYVRASYAKAGCNHYLNL